MKALLVASIVAGTLFVWLTSASLPDVVATRFDAAGHAVGFMSRSAYLGVMLGVAILVPGAIAVAGAFASALPPHQISVPNRDYWLAPERRQATLRSLSLRVQVFAVAMIVFLCFVHWLVVQANASLGKQLPQRPFFAALWLLLGGTILWLFLLRRRFRRVP